MTDDVPGVTENETKSTWSKKSLQATFDKNAGTHGMRASTAFAIVPPLTEWGRSSFRCESGPPCVTFHPTKRPPSNRSRVQRAYISSAALSAPRSCNASWWIRDKMPIVCTLREQLVELLLVSTSTVRPSAAQQVIWF